MTTADETKKRTEEAVASRAVTILGFTPGLDRTLPAGSTVRILARRPDGMLVVLTDDGRFGRISREEAGAFGGPPVVGSPAPASASPAPSDPDLPPVDEKAVWARLRTVFDPEIPVSVVDLGLVYECTVVGSRVEIRMTLTAPGCPVGDDIRDEIETKLLHVPGVEDVSVTFVWDPPWDRNKMSDAAKLQLGLL